MQNRVYLSHLYRASINYPIPPSRCLYAVGDFCVVISPPKHTLTCV
ncbi:MAG: hypothetical protein KAG20_10700 [Cocleimonas sp.]|nr:hypothetical protein [Cocleimonas sp.]